MQYTIGHCRLDQLRHRMMSRGMKSKIGTATVRALTNLKPTGMMMTGVGVVDWESGHAMTVYPEVWDENGHAVTVVWYYHDHQAPDVAADYRERAHILRVTHFPSDGYIMVDTPS